MIGAKEDLGQETGDTGEGVEAEVVPVAEERTGVEVEAGVGVGDIGEGAVEAGVEVIEVEARVGEERKADIPNPEVEIEAEAEIRSRAEIQGVDPEAEICRFAVPWS